MANLKLISVFLKVNLQIAFAYRADTVVNILINLMWLGWELLGLRIIFSNTDTLAGWGPGELIALLGVFRLVNLLMASVIWPATEKFNTSVRDGSLDYTLLQPANSLFLITFSRIVVWRIWELVLAFALIIIGIHMSGGVPSPMSIIYFLFLVASGTLVIYSLWIVLIALTFWFIKFDNNVTILQALMDFWSLPCHCLSPMAALDHHLPDPYRPCDNSSPSGPAWRLDRRSGTDLRVHWIYHILDRYTHLEGWSATI